MDNNSAWTLMLVQKENYESFVKEKEKHYSKIAKFFKKDEVSKEQLEKFTDDILYRASFLKAQTHIIHDYIKGINPNRARDNKAKLKKAIKAAQFLESFIAKEEELKDVKLSFQSSFTTSRAKSEYEENPTYDFKQIYEKCFHDYEAFKYLLNKSISLLEAMQEETSGLIKPRNLKSSYNLGFNTEAEAAEHILRDFKILFPSIKTTKYRESSFNLSLLYMLEIAGAGKEDNFELLQKVIDNADIALLEGNSFGDRMYKFLLPDGRVTGIVGRYRFDDDAYERLIMQTTAPDKILSSQPITIAV